MNTESHLTTVTVRHTQIRFYFKDDNMVIEHNVIGRLNVEQSKQYAKEQGGIYITKEFFDEQFQVETVSLLQLKLPNTSTLI